jgi:CheY-like chemotaxis protein
MTENNGKKTVLLAEDDDDHYLLARDALAEAGAEIDLQWVRDGEELMNYLLHLGKYAAPETSPRPQLIVLDLNMPKKDGREALHEIKTNPALRTIPVVVYTTSRNDEDIHYTYSLGGSFIRKPVRFEQIVHVLRSMSRYWLETVEQPPHTDL